MWAITGEMRKKKKISWKQFCTGYVGEITVAIQTDYAWQEQASCKTERLAGRSRNIFTRWHGQNILPSSCPASAAWWNTLSRFHLKPHSQMPPVRNLYLRALYTGSQTDPTTLRTLVSRTQKLPFEGERVVSHDERKQGKVISGRGNTRKCKTLLGSWFQIPKA